MADDKPGFELPNHTQTPNAFFDESLRKISSLPELKVVLAIIRKTLGWHKQRDKVSMSQLREMTGLKQQSVQRGIDLALKDGFITREPEGQRFFYSLKLVTPRDQSHHVTSHTTGLEVVTPRDRSLVTPRDTQKKGFKEKKERVQNAPAKDDSFLSVPAVLLYRDICHITPNHQQRQDIVKAVTDLAAYKLVLEQFMREGRQPQRVDWTLERYAKAVSVTKPRALGPADLDRMGV